MVLVQNLCRCVQVRRIPPPPDVSVVGLLTATVRAHLPPCTPERSSAEPSADPWAGADVTS